MKRRKPKEVWYADFETTQPTNNRVSVYLWVCLKGGTIHKGYDIKSFIEFIKDKSYIIYFHNLKFDFSYIQYYLIQNEIDYKLLEKKGQIYSVRLFDVELRDSLNLMPITLKDIGELYCTKYKKTSIDYEVYEGHTATSEEIEYCINDCMVLEEGLNVYLDGLEKIINEAGCPEDITKKVRRKLTNSGIAFEVFKYMSNFDDLCPKTTHSEYELFKGAYKGGYVYSNNMGIKSNVQMIDNNSMYPYIYSTIPLPYGKGIYCRCEEDIKKYKFYILKVNIKYELKDGYIPIIGGSVGRYTTCHYKVSSDGEFEELVFCNSDFELIKEFYDIEYDYLWGYGFETKEHFFKKYADTFVKIKNENKGIKRALAKVMLNSPYGKTAMNGFTEIKKYFIDDEGVIKSEITGYEIDESEYQYLPIAIAITAGARHLLLTTARDIGFENVLYMDTDSIKYLNKPVSFKFDSQTLGAWKDEGLCEYFKTIAPKKYVYYHNGILSYTCAGFSKTILNKEMLHNENVSHETALEYMKNFDSGLELECLQSKKIEGGRALLPIKKEIK